MKKFIQFGAGKIGRSFIAQIFGRAGYEFVFVDIDRDLIDEINRRKSYQIFIKGEATEVITISNIRGIYADDVDQIAKEISESDLAGISVGKNAIGGVVPTLAKGLIQRRKETGERPVDIILAENMKDAALFMREELRKYLPDDYPLGNLVGLIETSIGKMVASGAGIQDTGDKLRVSAEQYNKLIVDGKAFKNPVPEISDLVPKQNMVAWVDRKIFIHNLGHVAAAYYGHFRKPGAVYIYEVLADQEILDFVYRVMIQSATVLQKIHPDEFTQDELYDHIEDLLNRFRNRSLKDTIYRVGSDLRRKLGRDDRIAYPIRMSAGLNLPNDRMLQTLVCGIHFRARDRKGRFHPEDRKFISRFGEDPHRILVEVCGFNESDDAAVIRTALQLDETMYGRSESGK